VASLKPKLFCGVALIRREVSFARVSVGERVLLRHNNCQTTVLHGRATPPHLQNQLDVACLLQTMRPKRETIRVQGFTVKRRAGSCVLCVHKEAQRRTHKNLVIKYQITYPPAPITRTRPRHSAIISSLNLRYRLLSGGASEPCGKYGGGVYVAMLILWSRRRAGFL
jgi:hypothetical protein